MSDPEPLTATVIMMNDSPEAVVIDGDVIAAIIELLPGLVKRFPDVALYYSGQQIAGPAPHAELWRCQGYGYIHTHKVRLLIAAPKETPDADQV